jgi:hypothetical protein
MGGAPNFLWEQSLPAMLFEVSPETEVSASRASHAPTDLSTAKLQQRCQPLRQPVTRQKTTPFIGENATTL